MSYRSILVPLSGIARDGDLLQAGIALARQFNGRVQALHVAADPTGAVAMIGEGMSGGLVEEMIRVAEREQNVVTERARKHFDGVVADLGEGAPRVDWACETDREDEAVARWSRRADLVVLGRPEEGGQQSTMGPMTLETTLFFGGAPVMMMPPGHALPRKFRTVVVAWNGGRECAHALRAALPIVTAARRVVVLSVDGDHAPRPSPDEVVQYLCDHEAFGEPRTVPHPPHGGAGAAILDHAAEIGADLVVMGAYGHSRLREMVLGGATRHVLHHAGVPVFLVR